MTKKCDICGSENAVYSTNEHWRYRQLKFCEKCNRTISLMVRALCFTAKNCYGCPLYDKYTIIEECKKQTHQIILPLVRKAKLEKLLKPKSLKPKSFLEKFKSLFYK